MAPPVVELNYAELQAMTPEALAKLRRAFVGPGAYGAVAVTGIPGYAALKEEAFRKGVNLALLDEEGRKRAAAVNNTYPGWSGTPGGGFTGLERPETLISRLSQSFRVCFACRIPISRVIFVRK